MSKLLLLIKEQLLLLEQSKTSLQYSFEQSQKLLNDNYSKNFSLPEQDVFEAFASRLART